ncbi:hypothetical protein Bcep1808_4596 [Burkholderia vietnamiensis G4]|uniref:Uncharacterized protein n=1 Tax=Burkholderia vietnamiensis (strain G4 / LMG 22486) TaxID=269482 RepID=A4JMQ6_BURVG|nr:hypothetical protein Bcep1808_4596 [Burkholderia vietnamiensis G4]
MHPLPAEFVRRVDGEKDAEHRDAGCQEVVGGARAVQRFRKEVEAQSRRGQQHACRDTPCRSDGRFFRVFHTAPVYSRCQAVCAHCAAFTAHVRTITRKKIPRVRCFSPSSFCLARPI